MIWQKNVIITFLALDLFMDKCLCLSCTRVVHMLCKVVFHCGSGWCLVLLQSRFYRVKFTFFRHLIHKMYFANKDTVVTYFPLPTVCFTEHLLKFNERQWVINQELLDLSNHWDPHVPLKQSVQNKWVLLLMIRREVWEGPVPVNRGNLCVRTGSSVHQAHSPSAFFLRLATEQNVHTLPVGW